MEKLFGTGKGTGKRFEFGKISRFSIFSLILGINLFSITALSLFNYIVFHNNSKKTYLESFLSYNQKITDMAIHNIDQQIMQTIYNIPKLYFSQTRQNESVLKPQEEMIAGRAEETMELVYRLQAIQTSYPFIKSMDVYYENTQTVVTGFANVHFPAEEEEIRKYLPWYGEFAQQDKNLYFMPESSNTYPLQEPVLSYISRISQPRWQGNGIVTAVHISTDVFSDYVDEKTGRLRVNAADGRMLYESPISEEEMGNEITILSYTSPTTMLQYTYSMADSVLYADINIKNHVFLLNFLLSIVFNIALLMIVSYYSSYIYREKLVDLSQEAGVTIHPDNKSFDSSLKQLQEEILTLHDTANSSKDLRFQSAVRALLLNRKSEDACQAVQALEAYLEYDSCRVWVIQKEEGALERYSVEQIQSQFSQIHNPSSQTPKQSSPLQKPYSMEETIPSYHVILTTMEKGELVAVVNFKEEDDENILQEVHARFCSYLGDCLVTVGNLVKTEKDGIRKSYRSVCDAVKYRFVFWEQALLRYEDIQIRKRKGSGSHLKLFESMEKDINSENLLEFKLHLEMLTVSFKNGNYTIEYCHSTLRDLVTLIYQVMQHRSLDMWVMYGYDLREYYKKIQTLDQFEEWMNDVCEILLKNIRQKRRQVDEDGDIKTRLIQLIDENLENDISLDFLCDQFSMRPDVLSRVFKQVMGEGYTEYVKKQKMERAVRLMKENYNIKEIAQKLGYNSSQYFIKIFKETYGSTPYQYKKNGFAEKSGE